MKKNKIKKARRIIGGALIWATVGGIFWNVGALECDNITFGQSAIYMILLCVGAVIGVLVYGFKD